MVLVVLVVMMMMMMMIGRGGIGLNGVYLCFIAHVSCRAVLFRTVGLATRVLTDDWSQYGS